MDVVNLDINAIDIIDGYITFSCIVLYLPYSLHCTLYIESDPKVIIFSSLTRQLKATSDWSHTVI